MRCAIDRLGVLPECSPATIATRRAPVRLFLPMKTYNAKPGEIQRDSLSVNAEKIAVTGNKLDEKMYYRHSGFPGGLRERTLRQQLERQPTEVLRKAVKGMLPRNKLGRAQLTKLKIYVGPDHPHSAQAPTTLEV